MALLSWASGHVINTTEHQAINNLGLKTASFIVWKDGAYYIAADAYGRPAYGGSGNAGGVSGTEAYSVINTALSAAASAGGGEVLLKGPATYTLPSRIYMENNWDDLTLAAEPGVVLSSTITGSTGVVSVSSEDRVTLDGLHIVDATGAAIGNTVYGVKVQGDVNDITIRNCHFDGFYYGAHLNIYAGYASNRIHYINNYMENGFVGVRMAEGANKYWTFHGNTFNNHQSIGLWILHGSHGSIANNIFVDTPDTTIDAHCIELKSTGTVAAPSQDISIVGNNMTWTANPAARADAGILLCQDGALNMVTRNITISGNTVDGGGFANVWHGIYVHLGNGAGSTMENIAITGNSVYNVADFAIQSSASYSTIVGNTIHNVPQGIWQWEGVHNVIASNVAYGNDKATADNDGIRVNGAVAGYNRVEGNNLKTFYAGITEIFGGYSTGRNNVFGPNTILDVDAGGLIELGEVAPSATPILNCSRVLLDLSGGAADTEVYHAQTAACLCGYTVVYTEASSADVDWPVDAVRIGRIQDGVALDDDYFDEAPSEASQNQGYAKTYVTADLTNTTIAAGDTVTVGTGGGKTGLGEVFLILKIVETG